MEEAFRIASSLDELEWFKAVVEKAEAYLATLPDEALSSWYLKDYKNND